ncbi:MAG: hypothetical protein HYY91_05325 [Candidatus Omnitrophica bacterium]|nr:hypothetical protein [Candidatus Omnitrophota bacterium]
MTEHLLGASTGAVWSLASAWCLARVFRAWLGPRPSRRRVVMWLLVKFPLLYALMVMLLRQPAVSVIGFGVGFTLVLFVMIGWLSRQPVQALPTSPHGR